MVDRQTDRQINRYLYNIILHILCIFMDFQGGASGKELSANAG